MSHPSPAGRSNVTRAGPELKRTEKYLEWLRQQVLFTDSRLRMHESTRERRSR